MAAISATYPAMPRIHATSERRWSSSSRRASSAVVVALPVQLEEDLLEIGRLGPEVADRVACERLHERVHRGLGCREADDRVVSGHEPHPVEAVELARVDRLGERHRYVPKRALAQALDGVDVDEASRA